METNNTLFLIASEILSLLGLKCLNRDDSTITHTFHMFENMPLCFQVFSQVNFDSTLVKPAFGVIFLI